MRKGLRDHVTLKRDGLVQLSAGKERHEQAAYRQSNAHAIRVEEMDDVEDGITGSGVDRHIGCGVSRDGGDVDDVLSRRSRE